MAAPPGRHGQFRDWNHGLVPKLWGLGHVLAPKPPWPGYGPALATLLEGVHLMPAYRQKTFVFNKLWKTLLASVPPVSRRWLTNYRDRDHGAPMIPHMIILTPQQTGYGSVRHIAVSLPYVAGLVDGVKYMEAKDLPRLEGTELRRARAPSLRTLVRWAQKCDSAEQLGERLKRRYDRSLRRRGLAPPGNARADAELDRILGEP